MRRMMLILFLLGVAPHDAIGHQPGDSADDEAAIRKTAAAYAQAFNKHDAQAVAEFWSPDAVYVNRITGEQAVGRAAIAAQFTELFKAQPKLKLEIHVESIQFISPNVAVEHGTVKILSPDAEPDENEYSAVEVKRDGRWLLDRVTDKSKEVVPSHYEQLKPLEWMVGQWTTDANNAQVELECSWTKNQNFLTRSFKISIDDSSMSGMQIIGWDPAEKTVRSWTFDSNGTFAEATWEHRKDRWFIRNRGTLPDGRLATMVNVMQKVDDNAFTWQTVDRTADGQLLPNIGEIRIVRANSNP